jgi:hypothetical protein
MSGQCEQRIKYIMPHARHWLTNSILMYKQKANYLYQSTSKFDTKTSNEFSNATQELSKNCDSLSSKLCKFLYLANEYSVNFDKYSKCKI